MRSTVTGLVLLTLAGAVIGAASSLTLTSSSIGAGSVNAGRCSAAGLSVIQTLTVSSVSSVTVGGLPAACAGGTLRVAVHNGSTSSEGSATVPAGGGSVSVTLAVPVAVALAEQTDLVISGP